MEIRHLDVAPSVHPEAYVAPTAVLSGEVRIGRGSCVMHGAVLAAEGGAQMGRASSVALGGTVHIGCVVPPLTRIPIGWVAVGEPARVYPPGDAEAIRAGIAEGGGFLPFVFGIDEAADRREQMQAALQRYTSAIARRHRQDEIIPGAEGDG